MASQQVAMVGSQLCQQIMLQIGYWQTQKTHRKKSKTVSERGYEALGCSRRSAEVFRGKGFQGTCQEHKAKALISLGKDGNIVAPMLSLVLLHLHHDHHRRRRGRGCCLQIRSTHGPLPTAVIGSYLFPLLVMTPCLHDNMSHRVLAVPSITASWRQHVEDIRRP